MWNVVKGLRQRLSTLRQAPDRLRTATRLGLQTGLLRSLTAPGVIAMVRSVASGSHNPSEIYRIHAQNTPHKAALIWRGQTLTFAELDARIDRLAAGLVRVGIERKQSVIVMMRNRPELVEVGAAATRASAAAVAISWRSTPQELVYLANHSGARGIVTEPDLLPTLVAAKEQLPKAFLETVIVVGEVEEGGAPELAIIPFSSLLDGPPFERAARDRTRDEDAAVVIYTSGTTGRPKGAVRKFPKDAIQAGLRFINETPLRVEDIHLVTCPLYHSTAFGFLSLAQGLGQTVVLMDEWKPETFLELVERYRVTTTAVVPTMLHRLVQMPDATRRTYDASSLRVVFTGGAPLPPAVGLDFMDRFGDVLFNFYGATETGLVTLAKPADLRAEPATIGRAVPTNEIRLLDDDGRDVPEGQVGELYVKSAWLVAGYHDDDAATKASMRDGFFSVGDLARRDHAGRYFIEGRKRDMVISGGVNVYPAEVEGVLERHPAVSEVAVVGVPDPEWGERVRAFVVLRNGASADGDALKAFARERLAGPKVPRDFVFLDALPRNPTGKVLKRDLREL